MNEKMNLRKNAELERAIEIAVSAHKERSIRPMPLTSCIHLA
jgi:hypothetical protein